MKKPPSKFDPISATAMTVQKKVLVICPQCEKRGEILIPEGVTKGNKGMSTVLVRAGVICPHSYQVFLDKHCEVRGYQRTDYEVPEGDTIIPKVGQASSDVTIISTDQLRPVGSDPRIMTAIQDFLARIDGFLSAGTCAKGITELHSFIQSLGGFHPVLPDMRNWSNQLRVGASWDEKTKEWVKKRATLWLEKAS